MAGSKRSSEEKDRQCEGLARVIERMKYVVALLLDSSLVKITHLSQSRTFRFYGYNLCFLRNYQARVLLSLLLSLLLLLLLLLCVWVLFNTTPGLVPHRLVAMKPSHSAHLTSGSHHPSRRHSMPQT